MSGSYNRIALVPAYKPDEALLSVADGLNENGFKVIVVNDGSGKEFDGVFGRVNAEKIINLPENRGKGEALKAGTRYIYDNFKAPYIVLTIDADGQHRVEDALRIVEYAEDNPDEFVIGKRNLKLEGTPLRSKVGNNITHFGFRQATLTHLNETQTGLRAFSYKVIDKVVNVKGSRYEYEMIVLMKLARLGVKIHEIDIETVYEDGNSSSHFNPLPDSVRIYWSILKFAWPAIFCFFVDLVVFSAVFIYSFGLFGWGLSFDLPSLTIKAVNLIILSNIIARAVSTICDLIINKRVLFRNAKSKPKVILLYILLLLAVFSVDTAIVVGLACVGIIPIVGKIISTLLITWLSRILQTKIFEM